MLEINSTAHTTDYDIQFQAASEVVAFWKWNSQFQTDKHGPKKLDEAV